MCKGMGSWWRDQYIYRSRAVPMAKCKRVDSTALDGSINWPWSGAMINKVRAWEAKILLLTFRPRMKPDETWVVCRTRTANFLRKMGLPLLTERIANKIWTTVTWADYEGDVPMMLALRSILGWRTTAWWRSRASWGTAWDPYNVQRWKHEFGLRNRGVQWDTPRARWAGEGNAWIRLMAQKKPHKEDVVRSLLESMKQTVEKKAEPNGTRPVKKPRGLPPLVLDIPEGWPWKSKEIAKRLWT